MYCLGILAIERFHTWRVGNTFPSVEHSVSRRKDWECYLSPRFAVCTARCMIGGKVRFNDILSLPPRTHFGDLRWLCTRSNEVE